MNRRFFSLSKPGRFFSPLLWLGLHGGLFLALGLSIPLLGPPRFSAGLMSILPPSAGLAAAASADSILAERSSRQIIILAGSAVFAEARDGAEELYAALSEDPRFESLSLWADPAYFARFRQYLHDYRFMLLDGETRTLLENGGAREFASGALALAYGAFSFSSLDRLEEDPFLLVDRELKQALALSLPSALVLKDDVLAAEYEGNWYVMLRGSLAPKGAALTNKESAVQKIYSAADGIIRPGLRFFYSGVPFHSYESSSGAQREISLISTVSFIAILLLYLFVFRSAAPVLASLAALGCSVLCALGAALLVFRDVHVLSFVFGTTLIGTSVDYSLHYFAHWKGLGDSSGGKEIRPKVFRGIAMSFISTAVCFAALLFAPFVMVRQFAVFSLAGLCSSFLSVMCMFPLIPAKKPGLPAIRYAPFTKKRLSGRLPVFALLAVLAALLFVNRGRIRLENRLGDLYAMPPWLAESERINAAVLDFGAAPWYFIVSGADPQETLENEEELLSALDIEVKRGNLGSYMAASLFTPSVKTQRRNYLAAGELLPLADPQFASFGFPPAAAEAYRLDFAAAAGNFLLPGHPAAAELTANLWIGKAGERYYSCVLPLHTAAETPFREIAAARDAVFFVNRVKDIETGLDRLTRIMLTLFLAAFAVIAVLTRCCYSWKQSLRICAVPLFVTLTVMAVLSCLNIPLGFFTLTGLLLVFGLGLDYIFCGIETEKQGDPGGGSCTALAVLLSFITTSLSFGVLALSGFVPVHVFGITVFAGICAAYTSSILVRGGTDSENQRISGGETPGDP